MTVPLNMITLVSIHDVMPSTMNEVDELLTLCERNQVAPVTLLVVPGLSWSSSELNRLWSWESRGVEFAGHGWFHRCQKIEGIRHRFHSALLSRNVAEHLELTSIEIEQLLTRCADWFVSHGHDVPQLYVPPAWAMGDISPQQVAATPFQRYETLRGVWDAQSSRSIALPLVGFEADTMFRQRGLEAWNRSNMLAARMSKRPLRISIHPQDHRLRLARSLETLLSKTMHPISYSAVDAES
ncbi:MAG: polysaccharide deacetylase family protein [Planctomycetota bacterium]